MDKNGQQQTAMNKGRLKCTEADRTQKKHTEINNNGQK